MRRTSSFRRGPAKAVRLDRGPGRGAAASAATSAASSGQRRVLEWFQTWFRAAPAERRQAVRHEAAGGKLWLGWWNGQQVFTAMSVDVVNVSLSGALMRAAEAPPELHAAWACLDVAEPGDCVAATVLSVEADGPGSWLVRVEFGSPCPHGFLAATLARR